MTLTDDAMQSILADLTATGGTFDPADTFVGVATAIDASGQTTLQADVTYATGAMATRLAITTWGTAHKMTDGRWARDAALKSFRPASGAEAQTLVGWTLSDDVAAGLLVAFAVLTSPINLPDEFHSWSIVVRVVIDPNGRWSAEIAFNG